jgi:hypothetical protein
MDTVRTRFSATALRFLGPALATAVPALAALPRACLTGAARPLDAAADLVAARPGLAAAACFLPAADVLADLAVLAVFEAGALAWATGASAMPATLSAQASSQVRESRLMRCGMSWMAREKRETSYM